MTSQELFSCNAVDAGSELLLNSIIKNIDIPQKPLILDTGCGTGVLSLAMLTQYPDATVYALDRDALALVITGMNSQANGLQVETLPSLGARGIIERRS